MFKGDDDVGSRVGLMEYSICSTDIVTSSHHMSNEGTIANDVTVHRAEEYVPGYGFIRTALRGALSTVLFGRRVAVFSEPRPAIRHHLVGRRVPSAKEQSKPRVINGTRRFFSSDGVVVILFALFFFMAAFSKTTGAALVGAVTSIAAWFSTAVREFITKWTAIDAPGGAWRAVAIILALANLKNLPFMWHVSVSYALCQCYGP
jgi:hypothetical protein